MTTRIKLRRDTASNWLEYNPVLALAEPGVETDTNKMKVGDGTKSWSELQYVDGADVTRIKAGWIQSVGYIPEVANGEGSAFWFESVAVDDDMNSYYVGSNYDTLTPWTVKLNKDGEIVWQTNLGPFDGFAGEGQAVQIDSTTGDIVIVADMWNYDQAGGEGGMMLYRLSPTDGSLVGNPLRIRDDQSENSVDIYPYDLVMDGNDTIIIGGRNDDISRTEVTKISGTGQKIVINTSILNAGEYPKAFNDWYMSGTGINGEGTVVAINDYSSVGGTAQEGSGGNGCTFNFTFWLYAGTVYKDVNQYGNTGSGYAVNDTITIQAADVGASVDAILTVTAIGGSGEVTDFTVTNYTPDTSKIMLTIDPNGGDVNFSNSGTWNLIEYKGDSGFVRSTQNGGWTSILGNSDNDWFNVGAIDSNGNVYAAGITSDDDYFSGEGRSMLVKYNNMGVVQYKKTFDFMGSEGGYSDGYTGLCVDSQDNVYTAGWIWDFNNTGNWFAAITKVNSAGAIQWQKAFCSNIDNFDMWNQCLAVDSDDNVYLAAEFDSPISQNDDFFFAKFDTNGNIIWQRMLRTYGDVNSQWSNGYQSLKVKGNKLFYCASTQMYTSNQNDTALAVNLNTDGSGLGVIASGLWELVDYDLTWANTPVQESFDLNVGNTTAVFTTDEPVTGSNGTSYTNAYLTVYDGIGGEVGAVRQLTFEDGTVQTTASKPIIPQNIEGTLHGENDLTLRLDHAGQFIRINFYWNWNRTIYVPMNEDVPFEIGTVITIMVDPQFGNNPNLRIWPDGGPQNPVIAAVGNNASSPADGWNINTGSNQGKTGIYTLMKVDTDRWILSGPDMQENWC